MSPNVQKAEVAESEKCANSRLLQSWIYKNEPEQNFVSLLSSAEIIDVCPNTSKKHFSQNKNL